MVGKETDTFLGILALLYLGPIPLGMSSRFLICMFRGLPNCLTAIIIDREAKEIMHLVASVRLSVRLYVYALTAEPFDLRP